MFYAVVAAAFENISESNDIAVEIGERLLEGVSHACLCAQVNHALKLFPASKSAMPPRSARSILTKRKLGRRCNNASRASFSDTS
jgi:hypothetical protein